MRRLGGLVLVAAAIAAALASSAGAALFLLFTPTAARSGNWVTVRLDGRLGIATPTKPCPVTRGRGPEERYGNGLLSTRVASTGTLMVQREAGGSLSTKLGWLPHKGLKGHLVVRGERLDAPGKLRVLGVHWGHASRGPAASGSWASAVQFPSEGCWRITGRVGDVALSYVVRVVAR